MRRTIFIIGILIAVFLFLSIIIVPEYRLVIVPVTILYVLVLAFILRLTMKQYFVNAFHVIFCRRSKFLFLSFIALFVIISVSIFVLQSGAVSRVSFDVSKEKILSLSSETKEYLSKLDSPIEVIHIRAVSESDDRSLFNGLLSNFSSYTNNISYRSLHPIIDGNEYNELKKKIPTVSPGNVIVISTHNIATAEKVREYDIISAIYRARAGRSNVCVSVGHGEPGLNDFTEKGGAIISSILDDRGINLFAVTINKINDCKVFTIFEPSSDFTDTEIESIKNYRGYLVVIGGMGLSSVQKILSLKGFSVMENIEPDFSKGALREYDGGLIVDKFSDHPLVSTVRGSVVIESASQIHCDKCSVYAGVSSSEKTTRYVMVGGTNTIAFSGKGLVYNFFMRFKGNSELFLNMLSFGLWPDYPVSKTMINLSAPQFFAISPKYLQIIFAISVVIFPLIILLLSIYCFRQNLSSKD
ncbi:MAG: Gldg family protein [bacterium]